MAIEYVNSDTGELLPYEDAVKMWNDDYHGNDPGNPMKFSEKFKSVNVNIVPAAFRRTPQDILFRQDFIRKNKKRRIS